jgi:glutamine cyclotransferase
MFKFVKIFICCLVVMFSFSCCAGSKVHQYKIQVVKEYPHDPTSYTQGLFFYKGEMYETTGEYGESTLRKVDLATGKALKKFNFDRKYFLEGSVVLNGNLYILTWTNKVAFVYDAATLQYKSTYSYPREGWGLTTDGKSLIASDGSSRIYFLDENFKQQKALNVKMNGRSINMLNELEYIDGKIWANVYMTDMIVIINPSSGIVEGAIDCTGLLPQALRDDRTDVLNGIAYNPADGKIYLTGKNWKRLYEVKLIDKK